MTTTMTAVSTPATIGDFRSLADEYFELLGLPADRLEEALRGIAVRESELPEPMRYTAAKSRLEAWLELDREERRILGAAFRRGLATLPEETREQVHEAERGAVMNGLSFAQFRDLAVALDWSSEFVGVAA